MERLIKISFIIVLISNVHCRSLLNAQDLLVTINRDTLNCKMGKIKDDFYPITFLLDDEKMNGLIHKDTVYYFKKNFFISLENNRIRPWYPLVEIGFDAGVAYQFGKFRMDDDLTDRSDMMARAGFYLGTDLMYYISKRIGYGLKYNYRSLLGGDIYYQYFGPAMAFRFLEKNKSNHFFFSFSGGFGWMNQKNAPIQLSLIRPRIEMSAHSLSGDITVGYNFKCSKNVSFCVRTSCNIGYPGFVRISDVSKLARPSDVPLEIGDYCHNMNTIHFIAGFLLH